MSVTRAPLPEEHFTKAFALRELALKLLRADGAWEDVEGYPGKVRSFEAERIFMLHRTPFQPVPVSHSATLAGVTPNQQRDVAREYGLDVWYDNKKALSLIWNEGGSLGIVVFKQGAWEVELASLARAVD